MNVEWGSEDDVAMTQEPSVGVERPAEDPLAHLQTLPVTMLLSRLRGLGESVEGDYQAALPIDGAGLSLILAAIRDCRASLAEFSDEVEKDLLAEMGDKNLTVEGLGVVEAKRSVRRTKWDHDTLLPAIVGRLADEPTVFFDPDDGVFLPSQTIGHNVARRLRECVSFGAGKVTGLRALGIDPSEYCTEDDADYSIKLPARDL